MRSPEKVLELGWSGESQQRRASHRETSAELLERSGIAYASKNGGVHLIVTHGDQVVDFWPGTGKFIPRGGRPGRGVFNLMKLLGVKPAELAQSKRGGE